MRTRRNPEPGVHGWPDHACIGCSNVADQVAHPAHLNARDTTLVFVSRAPQEAIERLRARMGWEHIPWSTLTDDVDADLGVDEWHGTNAFIRDGERVVRTYRVDEAMGSIRATSGRTGTTRTRTPCRRRPSGWSRSNAASPRSTAPTARA